MWLLLSVLRPTLIHSSHLVKWCSYSDDSDFIARDLAGLAQCNRLFHNTLLPVSESLTAAISKTFFVPLWIALAALARGQNANQSHNVLCHHDYLDDIIFALSRNPMVRFIINAGYPK